MIDHQIADFVRAECKRLIRADREKRDPLIFQELGKFVAQRITEKFAAQCPDLSAEIASEIARQVAEIKPELREHVHNEIGRKVADLRAELGEREREAEALRQAAVAATAPARALTVIVAGVAPAAPVLDLEAEDVEAEPARALIAPHVAAHHSERRRWWLDA